MNELELIARLTRLLPTNPSVVAGAGDDCAILDLGIPERWVLFKTDAVVEGVHFAGEAPPEKIGHKALGRALSDIAAMAGTPTAAVISLGLPTGFDPDRVEKIYLGLGALARRHDVAIVGGEVTENPGGVWISVSLIGTVQRGRAVLRSGAKVGDAIFVTGTLGGSLAGRHLEFEPRLNEARWLAGNFSVHAMIDLSDGLASDLQHLLNAGSVGAEVLKSSIPISRDAKKRFRDGSSTRPPFAAAMLDGEDFELMFVVPTREAVRLVDAWKAQFPDLALACIGKVTAGSGITIRDRLGSKPFTAHGYVHFAQS